jgi:HEAT repeat protein
MEPSNFTDLTPMFESANWVDRFVAASMFGYFPDPVLAVGVDVFEKLLKDPVVNVRIAASRYLGSVASRIEDGEERFAALKAEMLNDPDPDVRNSGM